MSPRNVLLIVLALGMVAALATFVITHTLTPLGLIAVWVTCVGGLLTLFIVAWADTLIEWMRYIALPGAMTLIAALFFSGVFGQLTTMSPEERTAMHQAAAEVVYTDGFVIKTTGPDPTTEGTLCVARDLKDETALKQMPAGAELSTENGRCVVKVNWSINHTLAFPRWDAKNALGEFETVVLDQGKQLKLSFPAKVGYTSHFFFYNEKDSDRAVTLPGWTSTTDGRFTANATGR